MIRIARLVAAALILVLAGLPLAACGKKGPPVAPEPRGPEAPRQLTVRQIGDEIVAHFELPAARGTRPQQQPEGMAVAGRRHKAP